jgi:hypothetical protein
MSTANPFDAPEKTGANNYYYRLTVKRDRATKPDTPVFQLSEKRGDEYVVVKEQREIQGRVVGADFRAPLTADQTGIVSIKIAANDLADSPIAVVSMGAGSRFGKDALTLLSRKENGILGKRIKIALWDLQDPNAPKAAPKKYGWAVYDLDRRNSEGKYERLKPTDEEFVKANNAAEQKLLPNWWNTIKPHVDSVASAFAPAGAVAAVTQLTAPKQDQEDVFSDDLPF